ncbi:twin-arginine translocase TatA/TatE family subunit [Pseudomonas sp. G34]|jgi:sec-independent protein translocase protein TatA|uniref:twin-arginine translocase TatA/TatE family subunit n=1 Tax=Pseudomonas sp. G34 TaxID=3059083 RepID=UPI00280A3BDC|nr:twin-arginine translocase TatA/TatE family subunit [Pseudomonas sp. G34]MDQ7983673.1 twin-arginine translocase TatA/TatE family subunit [Pseudomonas sp. G34]
MGGIGIWQLVIVLLIVFLLFGSKRLKTLGGDLGETIQGFRKSMASNSEADEPPAQVQQQAPLSETAQPARAHTDRPA